MKIKKQTRREFLQASAAASVALTFSNNAKAQNKNLSEPNAELREMTIGELQAKMKSGELSAEKIVEKYIERIRQIDPQIRSIVELNPDVERIAVELDRERKAGRLRGALHGIPVLLKDNIDTIDKMKTTAGSLALMDAPTPKQDAFLVSQLRKSGAVILGKTNLSEWANFRSTKSSSGWSGRGGQTKNPYIIDRNPCGSSAGTGASVAANLAAIGIGTETDGSIVCPSSVCGIVGLKPTLGLVSRSGVIPIAHSQDTAGPMTRTVEDAAILLSVLVGFDRNDSITSQANKAAKDYTRFLQKDGLRRMRIGVARDYWGKNAEVDKLMNDALDAMKNQGATLVDVKFPTLSKFGDAEFEVLLYEFKADLEKYLVQRNAPYKTLADLIKFNEENAEREMPYFKQEIFESAAKKGNLQTRAYRLALQKSKALTQAQGIDHAMTQNKLDAIVAPSNAPVWTIDLINGDCGGNYISSSSLAAVAGYPNITAPAGFLKELPIGISFFGRAFSEPTLIKIAYAFEQATKARRMPKFLSTFV
ncbi:MAG: amidase [Acidobacteria bacterium]|jgi:amidase|nr:amidase [Acidobacteriota bacterium]